MTKKTKDKIQITEERKEELYKELNDYLDTFDKKNPKLTEETQLAVRDAANSGDKDLFDLATIVAYTAIGNHYRKRAYSYKQYSNTEINDLMSELYIVINENIIRYDGVHSLFTFFNPYINRAFMIAREKGLGVQLTKYYQDMGVLISRAYSDLAANDFDNPSVSDLSEYIKLEYGRKVSEKTILTWQQQRQPVSSLDSETSPIIISDRDDYHPEKSLENEEEMNEFYDSFDKLTARHKDIITLELKFDEENNRMPTIRELTKLMNKANDDSFTENEVKSLRRAAHKEFKSHFLSRTNEENAIAMAEEYEGLDVFTKKFNYVSFDEDSFDEDIRNAIENDIDYIFGDDKDIDISTGGTSTEVDLDDF